MKKNIVLTLICLSLCTGRGWAQSDTALLEKNLSLAHRLADRGLYEEAIALLDDAEALDPARTAAWPYEKGVVYILKEDYPEAVKQLRKAARFRDASENVWRLLGDSYLSSGDSDMAFETYVTGLQKFPDSGPLYYGTGLVHFTQMDFDLALDCFLQGLERDPATASNWFGAGAMYFDSGDVAFGMVDGETAVCIEPTSELSGIMRRALLATYREKIVFDGNGAAQVSFSKPIPDDDRQKRGDSARAFPEVYEETLSRALVGERNMDIPSLIGIRRRFVESWFTAGLNEAWSCPLFDYHRAIIEAGHFEAYNYWLFSPADPAAFAEWRFGNGEALDTFMEWFDQNPIIAQ